MSQHKIIGSSKGFNRIPDLRAQLEKQYEAELRQKKIDEIRNRNNPQVEPQEPQTFQGQELTLEKYIDFPHKVWDTINNVNGQYPVLDFYDNKTFYNFLNPNADPIHLPHKVWDTINNVNGQHLVKDLNNRTTFYKIVPKSGGK